MPDVAANAIGPAIALLDDVTDAQIEHIVAAAETVDPTAAPSEFASAIASATGLPEESVHKLVLSVLNFLTFAYQTSMPEDDRARVFLQPRPAGTNNSPDVLLGRVERILSVNSLCVRAKANYLVRAHGSEFLSSIVVTDVRPIFGESIEAGEQGMLIYHNLNLTYVEAGRQVREVSLACDLNDLNAIQAQIGRALEKHEAIEAKLQEEGHQVWFLRGQDDRN